MSATKTKILFIVDYCRKDYVSLLKDTKDHCELTFLFYSSPKEETNAFYKTYGEAVYWSDFQNAGDLLTAVKPEKVVFLYLESYNHIALNLTCKKLGLPTYLLEHGMRADYVVGFDPQVSPSPKYTLPERLHFLYSKFRTFSARIKNRQFLLNTIKRLPPEDADFVKHYIQVRKHHNYLETFRLIKSPKRLPDTYISFSSKIFQIHQEYDNPLPEQEVIHIGIPYFDHLANINAKEPQKSILFIDQPLSEQGLLQWDYAYKKAFAENFVSICTSLKYKLYVKPHPRQDLSLWLEFNQKGKCEIIDDEKLTELAPSVPLIFGFYSTYLMPFAAMKHTTLITYENHPAGKLDVSKSFIDAGVAHPIYDLNELYEILPNIEQLHARQLPNKAKFTEEWMYKFDGKSGERLRDILLKDE